MAEANKPEYLNTEFFEKALKCGLNESAITIVDLKISAGSSPGDNYCSEIYRAAVLYKVGDSDQEQTVSLIVKSMPNVGIIAPQLREMQIFEKEIVMYSTTLLSMSALLNDELLCAKLYYSTEDPCPILVFQDLKTIGFTMADREAGLDETHCRVALTKLARMHAASYVMAERDPDSIDKLYSYGMFKPSLADSPVIDAVMGNSLSALIAVASEWPGYESIVEKLKVIREGFIQKLERFLTTQPRKVNVINHGDMWVNNFMYKYENGVPVDMVCVDYQMSSYNSPGVDVNYFLCTSPQFEVRENKREELLDLYCETFLKTLQDLESINDVTTEMLKEDIANFEFNGVFGSCSILPLVMMNQKNAQGTNFEKLAAEEQVDSRFALFLEPKYQQTMQLMLKRFDGHGILDKDY